MKKCFYCEEKSNDLHFRCPKCENGMCEICYDNDTEHTHQYETLDSDEPLLNEFAEKYNDGWVCEPCLNNFKKNQNI